MDIKFRRVHTYAEIPKKSTTGAACYDVFLPTTYEPLVPGEIRIVKLGFELEISDGWKVNIRARSGLASKGILVANSVGIIDSDFRGEVGVILMNISGAIQPLNKGDRVCQLDASPIFEINWQVVDEIDCTVDRDTAGFGSSGGTSDQLH
jgi:dUTP pyrophosphatase